MWCESVQIFVLALRASMRMRSAAPTSKNGRGGNQPGCALSMTDCSRGELALQASSASRRAPQRAAGNPGAIAARHGIDAFLDLGKVRLATAGSAQMAGPGADVLLTEPGEATLQAQCMVVLTQ